MSRRPSINPHGAAGSALHRKLVADLVIGGAAIGGFRHAVEETFGCLFVEAPKIVPDAYFIRHDTRRIGIFEVTVSHRLTRKKLDAIRKWRDWIVGHDWSLRLLEINRSGGILGINPDHGEADDESIQRVADILAGRIVP